MRLPDAARRKLEHGELLRIAKIDRAGRVIGPLHQANQAIDKIVDIAKGARLRPVAIDGDVAPEKRLNDEVRDHPSAIRCMRGL